MIVQIKDRTFKLNATFLSSSDEFQKELDNICILELDINSSKLVNLSRHNVRLKTYNVFSFIFNFKQLANYEFFHNVWNFEINDETVAFENFNDTTSLLFTYAQLNLMVNCKLKNIFESFNDLKDYIAAFIWFYKSNIHISSFVKMDTTSSTSSLSIFDFTVGTSANVQTKNSKTMFNSTFLAFALSLKAKINEHLSSNRNEVFAKETNLPFVLINNSYISNINKKCRAFNLLDNRKTIYFKEDDSAENVVRLLNIGVNKSAINFIENDIHILQNVFLNTVVNATEATNTTMLFSNTLLNFNNLDLHLSFGSSTLMQRISSVISSNAVSDNIVATTNIGNVLSTISDNDLNSLLSNNSHIESVVNNKRKKELTIYLKDPINIKGFKYGDKIFHIIDFEKLSTALVKPFEESGFHLCIFEFTIPYEKLVLTDGSISRILFLDSDVKNYHANVSDYLCLGMLKNVTRLPDISMIINTISYFNFDSAYKNISNFFKENVINNTIRKRDKNALGQIGLICFEL